MVAAGTLLPSLTWLLATTPLWLWTTSADEGARPCSSHGDCAGDAYCTTGSSCSKCDDEGESVCSVWRDSIDGSCARCDKPAPRPLLTQGRKKGRKSRRGLNAASRVEEDDQPLPAMTVGEGQSHVVYANALTPAECALVVEASQHLESRAGVVGIGTSADDSTRRSEIRWLSRDSASPLAWVYPRVTRMMLAANDKVWGYAPTELEKIQIGTYSADEKGYYDWHVDRSTSAGGDDVDRVLSGSIQLTSGDAYEGGALQLGALVAPRDQGSLVIFPSYAMHSVRPVTKGVRVSLVLWLRGHPDESVGFDDDAIASHISAIRAIRASGRPHEPPQMQVCRKFRKCFDLLGDVLLRSTESYSRPACTDSRRCVQVLLGETLLKHGRMEEALEATRRAIALGEKSEHIDEGGSTIARARYNAGVMLSKLHTQGAFIACMRRLHARLASS